MGIDDSFDDVMSLEISFQLAKVLSFGVGNVGVQASSRCAKINNKETMIYNAKPTRPYTSTDYLDILGGPNTIDGRAASEECCTELLACEGSHHLSHIQTIFICESFANIFGEDVLICVHADDKSFTLLSPFGQLFC